jgi:monoterpene epsilon-lactone hydrolase
LILRIPHAGVEGAFSPWTDLSLSGAGVYEHLPPLLIQVGSDEVLLDDSRRSALAVVNARGTVRFEVWKGMHHVFQLNVEELVSARRALDGAAEFLTGHLDDWVDLLR